MNNPCVIEINDIALSVADAGGTRLVSACCAVVQGSELVLGDPARARARLNPRQTHERFWAQLDQRPLLRPAGAAKNHADLAWFNLHSIDRKSVGSGTRVSGSADLGGSCIIT